MNMQVIAFVVYTLLALFYFWVNHEVRPVWLDEALTYYQVTGRTFPEMIQSFNAGINLLPYGYFIIPWTVGQIVELDPVALRLPSLLFGILALIMIHKLLRENFGDLIAITSVFFTFVIAYEFSGYLSEARPYSLYTFVAALHLQSAFGVIKFDSRYAWFANVVISALFPSVHFVGLIYSFALALTVFVICGNPKLALRKSSSFMFGWLIFVVVHAKLLWLIFSGATVSNPDAAMRPSLTQAAKLFNKFFDLPTEVSTLLFLIIAMALILKPKTLCATEQSSDVKIVLPSRFLTLACTLWLLVPLALTLVAAFGFFSLTLPRYMLPSLIAKAIGIGMVLSVFCQVAEKHFRLLNLNRSLYFCGKFFIPCLLVAALIFSIAENIGIQRRVVAAGRKNGREMFAEKLLIPNQSNATFFTTDAHNFVAYAYHTRFATDLNISLVLADQDIKAWSAFAPQIRSIAASRLTKTKGDYQLCVSASKWNARSPSFELIDSLKEQGNYVALLSKLENNTLYHVSGVSP
jgi:hypothetical protein